MVMLKTCPNLHQKQSEVSQTIDLADLPTDKIDKVASLWFASVAIIVATLVLFWLCHPLFCKIKNLINRPQLHYRFYKKLGSAIQAAGAGLGRFIDNGKASSIYQQQCRRLRWRHPVSLTAVGSIFTSVGGMFSLIGKVFAK